jgi:arginase family enzyme
MHEDALAAGNLVITMAEVRNHGIDAAIDAALDHVQCDWLVIDCDIDVIDRSQMQGAPGARPAGMPVNEFFRAVRRLAADPRVRVIDLTEWDPPLDPTDLSALTAARWVAECLAGFEMRQL